MNARSDGARGGEDDGAMNQGQELRLQPFDVSAVAGGQMQAVAQRGKPLPGHTRCGTSGTFAGPNAIGSGTVPSSTAGS